MIWRGKETRVIALRSGTVQNKISKTIGWHEQSRLKLTKRESSLKAKFN